MFRVMSGDGTAFAPSEGFGFAYCEFSAEHGAAEREAGGVGEDFALRSQYSCEFADKVVTPQFGVSVG